LLPPACRFHPSCSEYADEALARYGAWRGGWLARARVCRCGPWHAGGYDPVPIDDGYAAPHSAGDLQLLAPHALGGLGEGESAQAAAAAAAAQQAFPRRPSPPRRAAQAPAPRAAGSRAARHGAAQGETVRVSTDLMVAEVDTLGRTLKRVELLRTRTRRTSART
jgi:putative membrane protein insertion efficiency factor